MGLREQLSELEKQAQAARNAPIFNKVAAAEKMAEQSLALLSALVDRIEKMEAINSGK